MRDLSSQCSNAFAGVSALERFDFSLVKNIWDPDARKVACQERRSVVLFPSLAPALAANANSRPTMRLERVLSVLCVCGREMFPRGVGVIRKRKATRQT